MRLLHTIDSSHRLATLCVGDRVRIGPRVSPRYLAGHDGTVVELDDRAATVCLDFPVGRFESGRVRCPCCFNTAAPQSRSISAEGLGRHRVHAWLLEFPGSALTMSTNSLAALGVVALHATAAAVLRALR